MRPSAYSEVDGQHFAIDYRGLAWRCLSPSAHSVLSIALSVDPDIIRHPEK